MYFMECGILLRINSQCVCDGLGVIFWPYLSIFGHIWPKYALKPRARAVGRSVGRSAGSAKAKAKAKAGGWVGG